MEDIYIYITRNKISVTVVVAWIAKIRRVHAITVHNFLKAVENG
jgi:hypothetical protein